MQEYLSILDDAFDYPENISLRLQQRSTYTGVIAARKSGPLDDKVVLKEIKKALLDLQANPTSTYAMWTRLRLSFPVGQKGLKFKFDNKTLEVSRSLPKYMSISRDELARASPLSTKDIPRFAYLIVRGRGKNELDMAEEMIEAANVLLSVFNLALRSWNVFGSEQRPEAFLLMGPYQFIFEDGLSLLENTVWYNPDFRDDFWKTSSSAPKAFSSALSVRNALAALENHPLRQPLLQTLRATNEAMETADSTKRTLRYWTALERLFSNEHEKIPYEKIIRRATFLEEDPEIARAKLNRLLGVRNRYVHWGASEDGHHQLNQYVAELIRKFVFYIIFNGDDFADHLEFLEMADLPNNKASLDRRKRAIERRERMISTRRHRS